MNNLTICIHKSGHASRCAIALIALASFLSAADMTIWHRRPAAQWNEATPIGNGRLGAMIFGKTDTERIQLNEDSLWSGAPQDADNPDALEAMPKIRQLLFDGKYTEAQELANRHLVCKGPGSNRGRGGKVAYGSYEMLGDLNLAFTHGGEVSNYRRELDLETAIAKVSYEVGGVRLEREMFSSAPDQALVIRLRADREGALDFRVSLSRPEVAEIAAVGGNQLLMRGQLWNGQAYEGMKFASRLAVLAGEGEIKTDDGALLVSNATEVTLRLTAATDYRMQLPDWRHGDPERKTKMKLDAVLTKTFDQLREAHIADYQRLFQRAALDLGTSDAAKLPTDERLNAVKNGARDPSLVALYFQFGRYLMISSSRPGTMPANLQGL